MTLSSVADVKDNARHRKVQRLSGNSGSAPAGNSNTVHLAEENVAIPQIFNFLSSIVDFPTENDIHTRVQILLFMSVLTIENVSPRRIILGLLTGNIG